MSKISVIIPTFNRAGCIEEAIKSVLAQTYQDFEIIIVDDGSTDDTKSFVEAVIKKNPGKIRYKYISNSGPGAARNFGILEAQGEYITFLDSDDLWLPEKLERSYSFITQYNFDWISTACCRTMNVDKYEEEILTLNDAFLSGNKIHFLKKGLFFFSEAHVYPGSVMIHRKCFKKTGLFDVSLRIGEDTDMWLRLEEAGHSGGYLAEPLFVYRVTSESITQSGNVSGLKEHLRLADKHAVILGVKNTLIRRTYSDLLWRFAIMSWRSFFYLTALKCFTKSWYLHPDFNKVQKMFRFIKRMKYV